MRADRLLSILLLLQSRERMTAEALAQELEVSVRTIYRDMTALSAAGIPVYSERGPGGGCRLVEDYRTTLTGLTRAEIQSLLLLRTPEPLEDLGAGQTLKTALLKVYASLPSSQGAAPLRLYLDWSAWGQARHPGPHLHTLYEGVVENRRVQVRFRTLNGGEVRAAVEPLGLVAKAGTWYLVYATGGGTRQRRAADFLEVQLLDEGFELPSGFDLEACWKELSGEIQASHWSVHARLRAAPELAANAGVYFNRHSRSQVVCTGEPGVDGWSLMEVEFEYVEAARTVLLGLGGAVEVLYPDALRLSLVDFARQALAVYEREDRSGGK